MSKLLNGILEVDFDEALKLYREDLIAGVIDEDYLIMLRTLIRRKEQSDTTFDMKYRNLILKDSIINMLFKKSFKDVDKMFVKVPINELPLFTTTFLDALSEYAYQIRNKNTDEEKKKLHDEIDSMFKIVQECIQNYRSDNTWIQNYNLLKNSVKFEYSEYGQYDMHYKITSFLFNIMSLYKSFNIDEADYISKILTGNTWAENMKMREELSAVELF